MLDISLRILRTVFAAVITCVVDAQSGAHLPAPHPQVDEAALVRIQRSIQDGDLRKARSEIRDTLQTSPGDPRLYNFLGVIDAQERNLSAAEANFERAIKIAPRFIGAYLNLGRLYQEESGKDPGLSEKALEIYGKVSAIEADNLEARYQAASLLSRLGKFDASLRELARLPEPAQHQAPALTLRCIDEAALQHTDLVAASSKELLELPDVTEADVLPIVPVLVKSHQAGLATTLLQSLVGKQFISPEILDQLAALYEEQGRFKDARETLTKELSPPGKPSAALLTRLSKVAYKSGDLEGTLGYLAHARDLEPENAAIHFLFGLVCIDLKLPPEAQESLRAAVRLDPQNPYYSYALGAVLLERRNPDEAIRYFRTFREVRREDPRGNFALGVAYFDAGQVDAARREFESIADHAQTRAGALLYLGRLALRDEDLAGAADHLQGAIQANPQVAEPYVELAIVQIRRKDYQGAEQNLNCALRLSPDNYQANFNLLFLFKRTNDPRAEEQSRRVGALRLAGEERERMLLRSLDIHPY
jgi:tetratricopeptide (TPR) repeat protein